MSYGLVICSKCKREVHQSSITVNYRPNLDGTGTISPKWYHCEDGSLICEGAMSKFPKSREEIVGKPCMKDEPPFSPIPLSQR